jgi:hypothetical protein
MNVQQWTSKLTATNDENDTSIWKPQGSQQQKVSFYSWSRRKCQIRNKRWWSTNKHPKFTVYEGWFFPTSNFCVEIEFSILFFVPRRLHFFENAQYPYDGKFPKHPLPRNFFLFFVDEDLSHSSFWLVGEWKKSQTPATKKLNIVRHSPCAREKKKLSCTELNWSILFTRLQ